MFYDSSMKPDSEPIRMTLAKNVKSYRSALQYSQEKLAEKTGLSVQTIKDIEGCRRWVSDSSLEKLAKALNINEFKLLLPEKYDADKKNWKLSLKTLSSLKEKLKAIMDDQFENALKSGDFF
jgi:transcriptional regulator with XRE-family HTH domain